MKKIIQCTTYLAVLFICILSQQAKGQAIATDPEVRFGKLSNGLTYYIRHNESPKQRADFYIVQKVGSVLEEEHQRGLAHFLEHMAFNGTKNFPGNSLITELEKKGIRFGSNINAYTSYDETVYKLTNIPVEREGVVDTALLVLYDWSGSINNNDKDIDEERGVIREEWRTRSNGFLRVQENGILPVLFAGTPYASRLPIGTLDIINNFKYQELRDYYKKWYRPDQQAIIIVGDVDVNKVEARLKQLFGAIPAPANAAPRNYYPIPDNDKPIVAIASDPEIRKASATVYWKLDTIGAAQKRSKQFYKVNVINSIISNMMNDRFAEKVKKQRSFENALAIMGTYSISSRPAWTLSVYAKEDSLTDGLKAVLLECERVRRFGFSKEEFEPDIKNFNLTYTELNYYDRNLRDNFIFTNEYVQHFLKGDITPAPEWEYHARKEILEGLTIDTLNYYAGRLMKEQNMAFEIVYPGKTKERLLTEADILKLLETVKSTALTAWVKEVKPNDRKNLAVPAAGKVIKTEKNTQPYGYTKWTLSNGVKVWFKQTLIDEAKIVGYGYKEGGYSQVNIEDLPSALAYNKMRRYAEGFRGFYGINQANGLERNYAWMSVGGLKNDPEAFFQYLYLSMTRFKKEEEAFRNWKAAQLENIKTRSVMPKVVYGDTLASIMANNHPRSINLANLKIIEQVKFERILRLHQDIFGNAHDFTFIITGNLKKDSVKKLAETWLGGLPSTHQSTPAVDHGMYPPKGKVKKHFTQKMETAQSSITIGYTGELPYTVENYLLNGLTSEILNKVYLREIREKEGGSYGVGVSSDLMNYPKERFIFQVNFDTDPNPAKKEKLMKIVYREINKIIEQGPDQEMVDKVKKNFLKDYWEGRSKENMEYWAGTASALLVYGFDWRTDYDKLISIVTAKKIQEFAKKIFMQGNIIEVVMDPEIQQHISTDTINSGNKSILDMSGVERNIYFEKRKRNFRDSGLKAWFQYPRDSASYKWFIETVRQPPAYWKDINEGAEANASSIIYSAAVDWKAIDKWEAGYEAMRREFLNDKGASEQDKQSFRVEELYGIWVGGLNKQRNRNGKLDAKKYAELCLEADYILASAPVGNRGSSITFELISNMENIFLYSSAYGWGLDELEEYVKLISSSKVPRVQQWVREKKALFALRNKPMQLKFTTLDNRTVDLEKLRGKVVLVDYWSTGCIVCMKRMGEIKPVYEQYKQQGFEVVSLTIDTREALKRVKEIKAKIGADWPTGMIGSKVGDKIRLDQKIFYKYGFLTVPQLVLLDKSGKMVAFNGDLMSGDIEPIIKKYLAE